MVFCFQHLGGGGIFEIRRGSEHPPTHFQMVLNLLQLPSNLSYDDHFESLALRVEKLFSGCPSVAWHRNMKIIQGSPSVLVLVGCHLKW